MGLPPEPPRGRGVKCGLCDADCVIPEGGVGYCGLVMNDEGRLVNLAGAPEYGILEYYYDPIPTNCVAHWFCPASTGLGYPKWTLRDGPELGYYNLAVFYGACNLDCFFCQNWFFRKLTLSKRPLVSFKKVVEAALSYPVTCVCFFGGDPAPQVANALLVAKELMRRTSLMRVCWETNGHLNGRTFRAVL
ncbi:MAG: radical SAM protein, partial [Candidatus Korarchaeum sp.]